MAAPGKAPWAVLHPLRAPRSLCATAIRLFFRVLHTFPRGYVDRSRRANERRSISSGRQTPSRKLPGTEIKEWVARKVASDKSERGFKPATYS